MENFDTKIEPYILGELPENERSAFEKALETDAELAKSVAAHREMMERLEALRLRKKVKKALAPTAERTAKAVPIYADRAYLAIAATLLLLATAIWFFKQRTAVPTPQMVNQPTQSTDSKGSNDASGKQETAETTKPSDGQTEKPAVDRTRLLALAKSYQESPAASFLRDAAESQDANPAKTTTQAAAEYFEKGNYTLAAETLRDETTVAGDENARFLRANARFKVGQYSGAAADFKALENSFQFKYDARWNYALCQLGLGKIDTARALLSGMVADKDFPFYAKAVELQHRLNF